MPMEAVRDVLWNSAALLEEVAKMPDLFRKTMVILPAQSDIQIIAFAKAPAVSLHVLAKIKLGSIPTHLAGIALRRAHLEFDFFCRNCVLVRPGIRPHIARHRAEMPSRTDDQRSRNGIVDDPLLAVKEIE